MHLPIWKNVMDAFTDPIDGIFDKEGMMAFMNTINNEGGELGQKMAREMLDSESPYDPDTAKVKSGRFKAVETYLIRLPLNFLGDQKCGD